MSANFNDYIYNMNDFFEEQREILEEIATLEEFIANEEDKEKLKELENDRNDLYDNLYNLSIDMGRLHNELMKWGKLNGIN